MTKAYFVATIEDLTCEIKTCVGYFVTQERAIEVVENNECDIHENCYKYAVIECIKPGLYQDDLNPLFYEWIDGRYQRIEKPKEWEGLLGFSIA